MPGKQQIPAPIDRPLSRAYVRNFTGWSTDRTPGLADPTSFRVMENVQINRDGSVRVRPGMKYLSYATSPDDGVGGVATDKILVGTFEPFYLNTGEKAYLQAVKWWLGGYVFFQVIVPGKFGTAIYDLDDPYVDFKLPTGNVTFSSATTYVSYVQVDNKIFAMSNAGEPMLMFFVGKEKQAKKLSPIERPAWDRDDKLDVIHPTAEWMRRRDEIGTRRNLFKNPSFEIGADFWDVPYAKARRPKTPPVTPISGDYVLTLETKPWQTNLASSPLGDVATNGIPHWQPAKHPTTFGLGDPDPVTLTAVGSYMRVSTDVGLVGEFYARSLRYEGVEAGTKYRVAYDTQVGADVDAYCIVRFYGVNDSQIGPDRKQSVSDTGRWVSKPILAPDGAVSMRLLIGGLSRKRIAPTYVEAKRIVVCQADENTDFFDGSSGSDYFWTGTANNSSSVLHPSQDIEITSHKTRAVPGVGMCASIYVTSTGASRTAQLTLRAYDKDDAQIISYTSVGATGTGAMDRLSVSHDPMPAAAARADLTMTFQGVARGELICLDAALMEPHTAVADTYFDGSTDDTYLLKHSWKDDDHKSVSIRTEYEFSDEMPTEATPTEDTLIATGGPYVNVYGFGFFYTFNNEVGESAPSKITEIRCQRPWSDWVWEKPNDAAEPNGHLTKRPWLAADQLVAVMPEEVWNEAVAAGATKWSLYMVTWSEQDASPVMALKVETRRITPDATYTTHGWARVTPEVTAAVDELPLPRKSTLYNYSDPSRGSNGALVKDRLVIVGDPTAAAVIRWTSNQQGEYTNFTPSKGGGYKTLTSGNLNVPVAVKLWQNPQSVDSIVILCLGTDGKSTAYYMSPAEVSSQSESVIIMGFEETTATPGTVAEYGVETFNNSLYHPLEDQLMKSTASNYNINHTSLTENIRNSWTNLVNKELIVSSQHDGRLYYIVNNPDGEPLEDGCRGNEIWVYDAGTKTGTWSRWLVQAHSLHRLEFGGRVYMGVTRPEGIFYFDPEYGMDDVVDTTDYSVSSQPISWYLESNTMGANRAHDAWCYLQQASVILGEFQGHMRFGIKSLDNNGKQVVEEKQVRDTDIPEMPEFDIEENLLIKKTLREWYFYAGSAERDGEVLPGYGQISLLQFRYTPASVNIGYEFGSIETFEYGRDYADAVSSTTTNGVPQPLLDVRRP